MSFTNMCHLFFCNNHLIRYRIRGNTPIYIPIQSSKVINHSFFSSIDNIISYTSPI